MGGGRLDGIVRREDHNGRADHFEHSVSLGVNDRIFGELYGTGFGCLRDNAEREIEFGDGDRPIFDEQNGTENCFRPAFDSVYLGWSSLRFLIN